MSRKYLVREDRTVYRDADGVWEVITGSRGEVKTGGSTGEFGVHLAGPGDEDNPRSGLHQ